MHNTTKSWSGQSIFTFRILNIPKTFEKLKEYNDELYKSAFYAKNKKI